MQSIKSVYDWQMMDIGEAVSFTSELPHQRSVRLRVNAPSPAQLWLQQEGEGNEINKMFLASVSGLDEIRFEVVGGFTLFVTGGEVWFDTLDGVRADVEPVDDTSFTTIVTRKLRNPEQEIMEHLARQNMEKMLAAQRAEIATMLAEAKATNVTPVEVIANASNGAQQAQQVGSEGTDVGADDGRAADGGANGS